MMTRIGSRDDNAWNFLSKRSMSLMRNRATGSPDLTSVASGDGN